MKNSESCTHGTSSRSALASVESSLQRPGNLWRACERERFGSASICIAGMSSSHQPPPQVGHRRFRTSSGSRVSGTHSRPPSEYRREPRIVVLRPFVDESSIDLFKVAPAGMESPVDDRLGNVVSAFRHSLCDTRNGCLRTRKVQEEELDPVTPALPAGNPPRISEPAQRGLECEALSSSRTCS